MATKVTFKDAAGRAIKVGDVTVHFYVVGHAMRSHFVIVRELRENGTIGAESLTLGHEWTPDVGYNWDSMILVRKKTTIKVPEYLVVVDLTEQQAIQRFREGAGRA